MKGTCKHIFVIISLQTSEGVPERTFKTLKDLIYAFEKPNQGLITNLRYPVKKPKALRRSQRFKSGMDNIYDGEKFSSTCVGFFKMMALTSLW